MKIIGVQYTCGECYTMFDLPKDMRCPTCKIREIVPVTIVEPNEESK